MVGRLLVVLKWLLFRAHVSFQGLILGSRSHKTHLVTPTILRVPASLGRWLLASWDVVRLCC